MSFGGASGRLVFVAIAVVAVIAATYFACFRRPDPVALQWLLLDCTVAEHGRAEAELKLGGERAERTLVSAFERGPSRELLDEIATEAGLEYDDVVAELNAGRTYGLNAGEIASISAISRQEHVRRAGEEFNRNYRSAALSGIGILGLPQGLSLLRGIAADPQSPDRAIAVRALNVASQPAPP